MAAVNGNQSSTQISTSTEICLDCRSVISPGRRCTAGHRLVAVSSPDGRERLATEVWGPPHLRRRLKQAALAGGGGGVGGVTLESACGLADCAGAAGIEGFVIFFIGAGLAILGWVLGSLLLSLYRSHRDRQRPRGAFRTPRPPGSLRSGRVLPAEPGREAPLARGLLLECRRFLGSGVMLRDGISSRLTVRLSDGSRVELPAGRLWVEAPRELWSEVPAARARAYLEEIDPARKLLAQPEEHDPIPFERALEVTIQAGDQVELCAELDWVADPQSPAGSYRAAGAAVGVPRGRCLLRLVSR